MNKRILAMIMSAFLAFGAVACDDTADGVETDTEQLGNEAEQGLDGVDTELDDAGLEGDAGLEAETDGGE